uniref:Uncharacterized protein n=1 Tax=Arundo donax TaxID=35708 RepID=A0A0A9AUY9_ARUDO
MGGPTGQGVAHLLLHRLAAVSPSFTSQTVGSSLRVAVRCSV